ncbi:MAG: Fused nickel transport protein NikMN [Deltaproteobacteria bacterium ADurb.Bin510]|nr:MAG: Fused nickel transport protein NikMN [Deltaproteobacteria bacterium ADurb.Bin510]
MHMADALISPAVGATMWAVSAGMIVYAARKVKTELDESRVPLMAVMAAFVFAAQMINFTIPATGSSGHLGGALLLAILLGPNAGFLALASVLTVQALFFADGGLLALGCNIFNMGFWGCYVAYPLIYRLGPFSVVLQTLASGITELPFGTFVALMQPIHLAIGLVEGLVTAAVVIFVWQARPELFTAEAKAADVSVKPLVIGLAVAAALTAGVFSWFASANPDGLEWSMFKTSGSEELAGPADGAHAKLAAVQEKSAFMPDYGFRQSESAPAEEESAAWPSVDAGTSVAGLVGGAIVLLLAGLIGFGLKRFNRGKPA